MISSIATKIEDVVGDLFDDDWEAIRSVVGMVMVVMLGGAALWLVQAPMEALLGEVQRWKMQSSSWWGILVSGLYGVLFALGFVLLVLKWVVTLWLSLALISFCIFAVDVKTDVVRNFMAQPSTWNPLRYVARLAILWIGAGQPRMDEPALYKAVKAQDLAKVNALLAQGERDCELGLALREAVYNNQVEMIQVLWKYAGEDARARAFQSAMSCQHEPLIRWMLPQVDLHRQDLGGRVFCFPKVQPEVETHAAAEACQQLIRDAGYQPLDAFCWQVRNDLGEYMTARDVELWLSVLSVRDIPVEILDHLMANHRARHGSGTSWSVDPCMRPFEDEQNRRRGQVLAASLDR